MEKRSSGLTYIVHAEVVTTNGGDIVGLGRVGHAEVVVQGDTLAGQPLQVRVGGSLGVIGVLKPNGDIPVEGASADIRGCVLRRGGRGSLSRIDSGRARRSVDVGFQRVGITSGRLTREGHLSASNHLTREGGEGGNCQEASEGGHNVGEDVKCEVKETSVSFNLADRWDVSGLLKDKERGRTRATVEVTIGICTLRLTRDARLFVARFLPFWHLRSPRVGGRAAMVTARGGVDGQVGTNHGGGSRQEGRRVCILPIFPPCRRYSR